MVILTKKMVKAAGCVLAGVAMVGAGAAAFFYGEDDGKAEKEAGHKNNVISEELRIKWNYENY